MSLKIFEMVSQRQDLAKDLSAGIDANLDDVATSYESFLSQTSAEGDPPIGARQQLLQLKQSIDINRESLEGLNQDVFDKIYSTDKVRSEVNTLTEKLIKKMRFARDTTRNLYGNEGLERTALKKPLPRRSLRVSERAQLVQASYLSPELNIQPVIDLSVVDGRQAWTPARLAQVLEPENTRLHEIIIERYSDSRKNTDARSLKRQGINKFDKNMRGIVRIFQGVCLLVDRDDLVARFSTALRRFSRRIPKEPDLPPTDETTSDSTSTP